MTACASGSANQILSQRTRLSRIRRANAVERLVRAEGLEPPQLSSLEPKSSASTNSATPAKGVALTPGTPRRRGLYHALARKHHTNRQCECGPRQGDDQSGSRRSRGARGTASTPLIRADGALP